MPEKHNTAFGVLLAGFLVLLGYVYNGIMSGVLYQPFCIGAVCVSGLLIPLLSVFGLLFLVLLFYFW